MTASELKTEALRGLRVPSHHHADAEAVMDRLLQPYAERDAKVAENNKTHGGSVAPYSFSSEQVGWLANSVRRELRLR